MGCPPLPLTQLIWGICLSLSRLCWSAWHNRRASLLLFVAGGEHITLRFKVTLILSHLTKSRANRWQKGSTNCSILPSWWENMNNMEKTENINQMTENTLFMIQNNLFMSLMRGLMSRTYSHWSQRLKNHNIRTWRTWSWVRSRWENIKWNVEPWIEMDEMEMVWNGEKIGKITIFWHPDPTLPPSPHLEGGGGGGTPHSAKLFWAAGFSAWGGGGNSVKTILTHF